MNDTEFIHVDFNNAKRVLCWRRGQAGSDRHLVVVANFSDFITDNALSGHSEYRVPNWPTTPSGKKWREITQERDVPAAWVGREPIFPWEAKVYAFIDACERLPIQMENIRRLEISANLLLVNSRFASFR